MKINEVNCVKPESVTLWATVPLDGRDIADLITIENGLDQGSQTSLFPAVQ